MGTAITDQLEEYEGIVQVVSQSDGEVIAVMPNAEEGFKVANFAITPIGGFGSVDVLPAASDMAVTELNFMAWLD